MQRWVWRCVGWVVVLVVFGQPSPLAGQAAAPDPPEVAALVERARQIAGSDASSFGLDVLCAPPSVLFQHMFGLRGGPDGSRIYTGKAFDNIYHIGFNWVGTWLVTTSDGLILIDALNNAEEAETLLVPAIRELGFDPADLRYVIVTHGHGDHVGGARFLQDRYGARIVLSEADWALLENLNAADRMPRRDVVAADGDSITLGETTIRILHTPGHTAGTISLVIPARWNGETHYLTLAGGSAMPNSLAGTTSYLASFHKLWEAGRRAGAVGVLSTHAFMHGAIERLERMSALGAGTSNPFILGEDGYARFMESQGLCVLANAVRLAVAN